MCSPCIVTVDYVTLLYKNVLELLLLYMFNIVFLGLSQTRTQGS